MKISVNRKDRHITVNDKWIIGGVFLDERCPECDEKLIFFDKYDANCCIHCNEWITPNCGEKDCKYCNERPKTPLEEFYK